MRLVSKIPAAILAAFVALPLSAQAPPAAFEVASVRAGGPGVVRVKTDPGRVVITSATLPNLIQEAYGVLAAQVSGAPALGRFEIEAKANGAAKRAELLAMLQPLLAERFKLLLHREMREMPVAALVVQKNGWKGIAAAAQEGDPELGFRGNAGNGKVSTDSLAGTSVTLHDVAKYYSARLNRVVVDHTGLAGAFDFKVDALIDAERAADRNVPEREVAEEIVLSLLDRMGLKLESRREPVEILVVDHAQQPASN